MSGFDQETFIEKIAIMVCEEGISQADAIEVFAIALGSTCGISDRPVPLSTIFNASKISAQLNDETLAKRPK